MRDSINTSSYRAEIDGLRAISILAILLCHEQIAGFRNGYVGVDIFFVISGFLISRLILKDLTAGQFSLRNFYERRFRRIAPALVVFLCVTSVFAYFSFLPSELAGYAKSLVSVVLLVPNIFFWKHVDYFGSLATAQPLLNTWSLGVEEQFYIIFPMLYILLIGSFRNRWRSFIVGLTAASFLLSVVVLNRDFDSAFYLPYARVWEFLLGALPAIGMSPQFKHPRLQEVMSALGLGLVLYAIMGISNHAYFPQKIPHLFACVGSVLIIANNGERKTWVGRILSFKPLVFVGLISYSLYLWHWPIFVFQGMYFSNSSKLAVCISMGLCFVLSFLTWKYVETPFRNPGRVPLRKALRFGSLGAATLLLFAILTYSTEGKLYRSFPLGMDQLSSYLNRSSDDLHPRSKSCFLAGKQTFSDFDRTQCLNPVQTKKNYLLLGDSHAAHLWYGLSRVLPNINFMQATGPGCLPEFESTENMDDRCVALMDYVFSKFLREPQSENQVDKIYLVARWRSSDLPRLSLTLDHLKSEGYSVVLFGPINEYLFPLPRLLAHELMTGDQRRSAQSFLDTEVQTADREFHELADSKGIKYVSIYNAVCGNDRCEVFAGDGAPLQFDYGHLTPEGSLFLIRRLADQGLLP